MDRNRLARLARTLVQTAPRRTMLGLGAASLLGALGLDDVDAKKHKKKCKKKCGPCAKCKKGKCRAKADGTPCPGDGVCEGGLCRCPPGTHSCENFGPPTETCCQNGEACLPDNTCGECPVDSGICDGNGVICGNATDLFCLCVTSVDGLTVCAESGGPCVDCSSDEECTTLLNAPAVCVVTVGGDCSPTCPRVCMRASCA